MTKMEELQGVEHKAREKLQKEEATAASFCLELAAGYAKYLGVKEDAVNCDAIDIANLGPVYRPTGKPCDRDGNVFKTTLVFTVNQTSVFVSLTVKLHSPSLVAEVTEGLTSFDNAGGELMKLYMHLGTATKTHFERATEIGPVVVL